MRGCVRVAVAVKRCGMGKMRRGEVMVNGGREAKVAVEIFCDSRAEAKRLLKAELPNDGDDGFYRPATLRKMGVIAGEVERHDERGNGAQIREWAPVARR
jgi:hypothetical protein